MQWRKKQEKGENEKEDTRKRKKKGKKGNKRDHKLDPRGYSLVYDTGNWEEGNGL
jgi:hypothetical protein